MLTYSTLKSLYKNGIVRKQFHEIAYTAIIRFWYFLSIVSSEKSCNVTDLFRNIGSLKMFFLQGDSTVFDPKEKYFPDIAVR